ncbi:MAG: selenocysteine-specific translation elongation factor [Clostridiales bacterium]|nr:selenocysteine-specific translation elongation factor [Clostridiales bacterium]
MKHIIIGTAGHIDHGKTALIKALTGRDTDTLEEEKKRGISINLGFTYFDLPSGKRAGIIDVPGHEKFIKNMLAGASGIDMVLLVIAADEGIMPQTREHLNILSLLDIKNGIVVVTKTDIVEKEWLDAVIEDIREYLKGTFLQDADIVPVSSVTGKGIDTLVKLIDRLSDKVAAKDEGGIFRLPIDRVFTISGFGTVITGTLISGKIDEGDKIEIFPVKVETRARSIQVHEQPVKTAYAGQRVAINIANIKVEDIRRGYVAASIKSMEPSTMIDCRLNYLKDAGKPLKNRERVRVYQGTEELFGRVILLEDEELKPGESSLVQIRLESPISALSGDKYIIRRYSPMFTIGGGTIINSNAKKHKRFDREVIDELAKMEKGDLDEIIENETLKTSADFPDAKHLAKSTGKGLNEVGSIIDRLIKSRRLVAFSIGDSYCYVHRKYIDEIANKFRAILGQFHEKYPLRPGMSKEELKSRALKSSVKQNIFDDLLVMLKDMKEIKISNKYISLYDFEIRLDSRQEDIKQKIMKLYGQAGINVPKTSEVIDNFGADKEAAGMVLGFLMDNGQLVKINEDMIISRDTYDGSISALKGFINKYGDINLAQYRDLLKTTRKYAVSLLEYFDDNKITKRIGDKRILI